MVLGVGGLWGGGSVLRGRCPASGSGKIATRAAPLCDNLSGGMIPPGKGLPVRGSIGCFGEFEKLPLRSNRLGTDTTCVNPTWLSSFLYSCPTKKKTRVLSAAEEWNAKGPPRFQP